MNQPFTYCVRRGFTIEATPFGDSHCGVGQKQFEGECEVETSDLDVRGFVIENGDIQRIAEEINRQKGVMKLSCERYCRLMVNRVRKLMYDAGMYQHLVKIKVKFGPHGLDANATCIWKNFTNIHSDLLPDHIKDMLKRDEATHLLKKLNEEINMDAKDA